jgi:hypothetical protein
MVTIKLQNQIDITGAEKLLDSLSQKSLAGPFCIDASSCDRIDIGAGYRIGNVIARLATLGPLTVLLPAGEYTVQHVPKEFFWVFTRSGLGPAIARHASVIRAGTQDVTDIIRAYYRRTLLVPSNSSAYVTDLHLGAIDVEDEGRFGRLLIGLLGQIDLRAGDIDRRLLGDLVAFSFEAVQNVVDHATAKPHKDGASIFSYLALRYYGHTAAPSEGLFGGYVRRYLRERGKDAKTSWLEIVISDDGNGIPARHAQSAEIYWEPSAEREEEVLAEALARSSVKLRAGDSKVRGSVAGEGFSRIRTSFRELAAFASVRTGRCLATFDGLSTRRDDFHLERDQFGLFLGYMPGTTVQVVVPIVAKSKQETLF